MRLHQLIFSIGCLIHHLAKASEPTLVSDLRLSKDTAAISAALVLCVPSIPAADRSRVPTRFFLFTPDHQSPHTLPDIEGLGEIHVRGGSSAFVSKKSYAFEIQDGSGNDLKIPLCGLAENSDWILYASYLDKTFIRDTMAYELWRDLGYWAPRTKYIELFITTNFTEPVAVSADSIRKEDYQGLYVLVEKIKRGKHRLNVQELKPRHMSEPEITGGYVFKKDRLGPGEVGMELGRTKTRLVFVEPKEREITGAQRDWLTNYLNHFETVLLGVDFCDPEQGYRKFIDVDSFIDYHWMTEFGKNFDGYAFSQFYHKDRNGKLRMGPLWDWDLSLGNPAYAEIWRTNKWRCDEVRGESPEYWWFKRLFEDPDFLQRYIDRWSELRTNILAESNLLARVDRLANEVRSHIEKNYDRWPRLRKRFNPSISIGPTYEDEVTHLKNWITGRLAWIDSQDFPKPVLQVVSPLLSVASVSSVASVLKSSSPDPSSLLSLSCDPAAGSIFYTTNNTDPRLPGGHVSTNALEYKSPISITPGLHVRARVRSEFGLWSAPAVYP
jgi:signal peptidase I